MPGGGIDNKPVGDTGTTKDKVEKDCQGLDLPQEHSLKCHKRHSQTEVMTDQSQSLATLYRILGPKKESLHIESFSNYNLDILVTTVFALG